MAHVASLVFGKATSTTSRPTLHSTFRGGGKVWKVEVGVKGAFPHRAVSRMESSTIELLAAEEAGYGRSLER